MNLPNQWKNSSYGIKYFRCEGFDYDVWQKNSDADEADHHVRQQDARPAGVGVHVSSSGLYGPPDPPMAQAYGLWLRLKLYSFCFWAFDQFCLNSRPVPLEIVGQMQVTGAQYFKPNAARAVEIGGRAAVGDRWLAARSIASKRNRRKLQCLTIPAAIDGAVHAVLAGRCVLDQASGDDHHRRHRRGRLHDQRRFHDREASPPRTASSRSTTN